MDVSFVTLGSHTWPIDVPDVLKPDNIELTWSYIEGTRATHDVAVVASVIYLQMYCPSSHCTYILG